jgi:hypothetical protein
MVINSWFVVDELKLQYERVLFDEDVVGKCLCADTKDMSEG